MMMDLMCPTPRFRGSLRLDLRPRQPHRRKVIDLTLEQLREQTPPNTPWFGLDLGEKTIGVATSDPGRVIASPLQLIRKAKFTDDANALLKLMDARQASGLVIGLPLNMDGSEGPRAQSCRAFARNLQRLRAVPVAFQDERLSTSAVERFLIEDLDLNRKRRAQVIDRTAAAWILQGALDRLKG
jgi:putative holliday junction resolvase